MTNELKITGIVKTVLPSNTGTGSKGQWTKQEVLIMLPGPYPKDLIITAWNDLTKVTENLKEGSGIVAHINLESREHNNRWYTEAKAWKLDLPDKAEKPKNATIPSDEQEDDLPF